mmetsp:Transcript_16038/g.30226  ORF Transcript_16038/g.30226 Transcript_16038/m.30226 type:complete len:250 (+) Transcript_16038:151-900(+)
MRGVVLGEVRHAAVHHDAGAHPVMGGAGRVAQRGGAVRDAALAGQAVGGGLVGGELVGDAVLAEAQRVGVGEVRHQPDLVDLGQGLQPGIGRAEGGRPEAEPVHARVQLQEHPVRLVGLVHGQPVDLLLAMHRVPELEPRAQLQVARLEHALQQQDGAAPVQRAQPLGLGQVQQREAICRPQAGVGALDAVAVGIGLDDGPDTGIGRLRAGTAEVVGQGVGVDQGFDGARHDAILRDRAPSGCGSGRML